MKSAKPHRRTRKNHHHEIHRQRRDRMGGNQTGQLRLGGILSNAKGNQSPRRKPEPHPTESANPGTPAPVPLTDPLRDDTQAKGKSSIGGSMADETSANLFWQHFGRIARKVAIYGSPLWTLLIICGLLLATKRSHWHDQENMAARSSVWQPAGNRSPRSHGKADSTFEAHAANRRFRSRIRWIFPARPCSLWAAQARLRGLLR